MELSDSQASFYFWMEQHAPQLMGLWDWNGRSVNLAAVESYISTASHGEAIMCRFFVGVWLGRNDHGFNMIAAAGVLDQGQRAVIAEWLMSPLWP